MQHGISMNFDNLTEGEVATAVWHHVNKDGKSSFPEQKLGLRINPLCGAGNINGKIIKNN